MKVNFPKLLVIFIALAMFFTSCKNNPKTSGEVPPDDQSEESEVEKSTKEAKHLVSMLCSKAQIISEGVDKDGKSVVYFYFTQPIDHQDASAGTFNQYCAFHYEGSDKITVLHTQGYSTAEPEEFRQPDVAKIYGANFLEVEHRYYKHSEIGDSESQYKTSEYWNYNVAEQSTADLHEIVISIKKTGMLKGKWISTGGSKNGILTALYAFYYPNDIDVYVPFCAPFIHGLEELKIGQYVTGSCAAGTRIQEKSWNALKLFIDGTFSFVEVADLYNTERQTSYSSEQVKSFIIFDYMRNMFQKFAYQNIYAWGDLIPDENSTEEHFYRFATLSGRSDFNKKRKALMEYLGQTYDRDYYEYDSDTYVEYDDGGYGGEGDFDESPQVAVQKNVSPDILGVIYFIQAAKELGYFLYDWTPFENLDNNDVTKFNKRQTVKRYNTGYGIAYDDGKLMNDFISFLQNNGSKNKCKMLFVYGANDPWTGAAIPDSVVDDINIKKYVVALGVHSTHLNNTDHYSEAQKNEIITIINNFLK